MCLNSYGIRPRRGKKKMVSRRYQKDSRYKKEGVCYSFMGNYPNIGNYSMGNKEADAK